MIFWLYKLSKQITALSCFKCFVIQGKEDASTITSGFSGPLLPASRSQSLDFTAVLPEIVRLIGNWGMAVRCWGTKRRQGDMEYYQPSSLSLQIWDKGLASRKAGGSHTQTLSPGDIGRQAQTHTEKNIKPKFHIHTTMLAACLLTYV